MRIGTHKIKRHAVAGANHKGVVGGQQVGIVVRSLRPHHLLEDGTPVAIHLLNAHVEEHGA